MIVQSNVPVTNEELTRHMKLYQLPADKQPLIKGEKPVKNYAWTSAAEVTDDLLAEAPALQFTISPTAEPYSTLHSIRLDTDPGRWLYARITKGLPAKGDYVLSEDYNSTVMVPAYSKEVRILSDGALLSLSGDKKISVYSLGAQKLRFQVERVMNDDISHLVKPNARPIRQSIFRQSHFTAQNITERFSEEMDLAFSRYAQTTILGL